jgi:hypothetical protein
LGASVTEIGQQNDGVRGVEIVLIRPHPRTAPE